jgi:hypothetical protein
MTEQNRPRKTAATTPPADRPAGPPVPGTATVGEQQVVAAMATATELGARTAAASRAVAVGEAASSSDVTDELTGGGVAFGEFVKSIGLAVAAAQTELDKNLVETAKALSETQIDVIAVFEQQINDEDGTMDKGNIQMQKLPLINYLMPTAYNWKRVYLEADMNVQEFNGRSGINIQQQAFSVGATASGGFGVFGGGFQASASTNFSNSSTGVEASTSSDTAAGKLHMEATLEPRTDIELPRPFVLQKGPQLDVRVGARVETHQDGDETKPVTASKVTLTATLKKTDGSPNTGKPLAVSVSDPLLTYTSLGKSDGTTGEMTIDVTRKVLAPEDKPIQALVRVSFGLVTRTAGIVV